MREEVEHSHGYLWLSWQYYGGWSGQDRRYREVQLL
jgi:hypothetical protein